MSTVKTKAIINKMTRVNGKAEAQLSITIPVAASAEMPLGEVFITVQEAQLPLFGEKNKVVKGKD